MATVAASEVPPSGPAATQQRQWTEEESMVKHSVSNVCGDDALLWAQTWVTQHGFDDALVLPWVNQDESTAGDWKERTIAP